MDIGDVRPFLDFLLPLALERTLQGVFSRAEQYADTRPHFARGCMWLLEEPAAGEPPVLRLAANRGKTETLPSDWRHSRGDYTTVPLDEPIVGRVARDGVQLSAADEAGWDRPPWAREAGIVSYAASPMVHKGEVLGVTATFYNRPCPEYLATWLRWHSVLGHYLGAAVANARAFEAIERLRARLTLENEYLREEAREVQAFGEILGESPAMRRMLSHVARVAPTDASVLLLGESGTGKELVARAIHEGSRRRERTLVKVNCASVPRELFESEFFGHVRGSFTGAVKDRTGRFELAEGGTLFLDEVGEIPLELQPKLLRVLQEGTFERIGDEKTRRVDVRVIAATNRDLSGEVAAGRFRQDLYFRLSVFPIELPPLRERPEDLPVLARHFLALACRRLGTPPPALTAAHETRLREYDWPGNVRELQNLVERTAILSRGGELLLPPLPRSRPAPPASSLPDPDGGAILTDAQWRELERRNLLLALEQTGWTLQGPGSAAELLGIPPTTLRSRMKALGVERAR
ncbi:MAG: sigma 54-interacting transcriptional regulator [Deltaproteobacteria bacterium]|nr:sigma 54-interacting transcriptional regulator [Deltaproteobacteria bacterium]